LDTKSEAAVQAALDQASIGRTTITIAHRLSTVRNAHKIIVLNNGRVAEQGSHDVLLANRATYYGLVASQELQTQETETEPDMAEERAPDLDMPTNKDSSSAAVSIQSAPATASPEVMALNNTEPSLGDENQYSAWTLIKFVFGLNKQETTAMIVASFFCVIAGLAYPVQAGETLSESMYTNIQ
jgi:ATP-binding cassette, subfamily B (MDR/TAP), member 1